MSEEKHAVIIGMDWADQQHAVCVYDPVAKSYTQRLLDHTPSALQEWAADIRLRFPGYPVWVCLEQSRGALVLALNALPGITCYAINPKSLARYRESRFPSRSKNDPKDARLLCEYLRHHHQELRPLSRLDAKSARLAYLTEHRRKFVHERTRHLNRLRAELKVYFPQLLHWFGEINSTVAWQFLLKWPTLQQAQSARPKSILSFLYAHQVRRGKLITELPEAIKQAMPLHDDEVVIETSALQVQGICHALLSLETTIRKYDELLKQATAEHPEAWMVESLPGAGPQLKPRLLAAFGSERARYSSPEILAQLAGIAPVCETSGQMRWIHFRWAASTFMRQTFHEFALHSLASSTWARAYYQAATGRGKSHHVAIRALAFKWIRILHACWMKKTPYNEDLYLKHLHDKGSPYALAA